MNISVKNEVIKYPKFYDLMEVCRKSALNTTEKKNWFKKKQQPVSLHIIEVHLDSFDKDNLSSIKTYQTNKIANNRGFIIDSWVIDLISKETWTNTKSGNSNFADQLRFIIQQTDIEFN